MSFLLNANHSFIIVDNKPRQGLFYQIFNSTGFSRPLQIQPALSNCYTATLDSSDSLHVVAQNHRNQIIHYTYIDSHAHSTLIVDDNKDIYKFSNLILHALDDSLHLFYTALRPNTNTYSLLHQQIAHGPSPIEHLLASFNPLTPVKSICQNGIIYLLFITAQSDAYSLNCLTYSSNGTYSSVLLSSEFPIIDFDISLVDDIYHITYIQDTYGNYQLLYFNSQVATPIRLYTSNQLGSPCIFRYLGYLWINYLDNDSLYTLLSTNTGLSFSSPVKASLQNNLAKYTYYSRNSSSLEANQMYATVFNKVRLAIVSSIDTDGIHPDIVPNTELDLLLAGLSFSSQLQSNYSQPSQPISSPTHSSFIASPVEQRASSPYIAKPISMPTSQTSSKPNSVLSAAQAFMNEVNMFDAQPIYLPEEK